MMTSPSIIHPYQILGTSFMIPWNFISFPSRTMTFLPKKPIMIMSWRKKGRKKSRTNKRRQSDAKGNPANLRRACRNNNLPPPDRMTDDELERELTICQKKLCQLQITSPSMRRKHLERRLKHHLQRDNKDKVQAIAKILTAEKAKRIWKNPRRVFTKKKSAPPSTVETKDDDGILT